MKELQLSFYNETKSSRLENRDLQYLMIYLDDQLPK